MTGFATKLPALLVAAVVTAYWIEVMRMVRRARRRRQGGANLFPPEAVGRAMRWIWFPIIFVWVITPWLVGFGFGFGLHAAALRPLWHAPAARWPAAIIVVVGWFATRRCWRRMGASWRIGIDPSERTDLIDSGAYAQVRHPIYALSQMMMAASVIAAPASLLALAAALHIILMQWECRREEAHLLRIHGPAYADYLARVPRFVPAICGPAPSGE